MSSDELFIWRNGPFGVEYLPKSEDEDYQWYFWLGSNDAAKRYPLYAGLDLEDVLNSIFEPFILFDNYRSRSLYGPFGKPSKRPYFPFAIFLSEWKSKKEYEVYERGIFEHEYEAAKSYFLKGETGNVVPRNRLPELSAERDLLENQVRHAGEQLASVIESIERILKAWVTESLRHARRLDSPSALFHKTRRFRILSDANDVWRRIARGNCFTPPSFGWDFDWLQTKLRHDCVPADFTNMQLEGILYYNEIRETVLEYAYRLDQRRRALEWVLYYALLRKPLRKVNQISEATDEQTRWLIDGRATGKHLEKDLVRCYWVLFDISRDEQNSKEIRKRVLKAFNSPVGDRQFQNYLNDNERPILTDEEIDATLKFLDIDPQN